MVLKETGDSVTRLCTFGLRVFQAQENGCTDHDMNIDDRLFLCISGAVDNILFVTYPTIDATSCLFSMMLSKVILPPSILTNSIYNIKQLNS